MAPKALSVFMVALVAGCSSTPASDGTPSPSNDSGTSSPIDGGAVDGPSPRGLQDSSEPDDATQGDLDASDESPVIQDAAASTDSSSDAGADAGYCNVSGIPIYCTSEPSSVGKCETGYTLMTCCVGPIAPACTPLYDGSSAVGVCCPD
jgi:hypothetical protein